MPSPPEHALGVGPTLAYAHAPRLGSALVYGVDLAYAHTFFWGGGGVRVFETFEHDQRKVLPYVEVGVFLLLNIGAGYTFDAAPRDASVAGPHLFLGLPLPLVETEVGPHRGVYYVEPYYRATYGDVGTLHEGGVFVKWSNWD